MEQLLSAPQALMDRLAALLEAYPLATAWYTAAARFVFPVLALLILARTIRSLVTVPHVPEVWAYLSLPNGADEPLTHWENIIGRSGFSDVVLNYPTVSRQHAALIRGEDRNWTLYDLDSKGGVAINGRAVAGQAAVQYGDVLSLGGVETVLLAVSPEEEQERRSRRRAERPVSPWLGLVLLTLFQVMTAVQLVIAAGERASAAIPMTFLCLSLAMWAYCLTLRALRRIGFEMETVAFFLSTLSLAVTASSAPSSLPKQFLAVLLGLLLFLVLGVFLRDLERAKKIRWLMAAAAIGLLGVTLLLGTGKYGAKNWIVLGPLSLQPSELAKICYIFAGSATLDRLFRKRNLGLFIVLTGACMGGAAVVVTIKPYILQRFATWGHAWSDASGGGYQQTRAMSAAASGGLVGVGAGKGWLHRVPAADTDLVFGMLAEEWGLVIAALAVLSIVTLAVFAVRACRAGRSSFYTIAACAAASLMVFQTCLNVFGSVDLLPFTGVTFPFVSNGGSAMVASWGLLAFLKATDTRQNASFAIRLPSRRARKAPERQTPDSAEQEGTA